MTKLLTESEIDTILDPPDPWIVVWVTYDAKREPYWCGLDGGEHVWSPRPRDAFRFPTREHAEGFGELSDFFEGGNVEARRLYPRGGPR